MSIIASTLSFAIEFANSRELSSGFVETIALALAKVELELCYEPNILYYSQNYFA
jgi:hypothetical protein